MGNEVQTTTGSALPAIQHREKIRQVFQDNYNEGIRMGDLERIRIPSGGGKSWRLDTLQGEEYLPEIQGVIVAWHTSRSYFLSEEDERPTCSSLDGKTGNGIPGGDCASCSLAVFREREGGGGGSACREQRTLYLLTDKGILPLLLILPATSIAPFRKLMVRLSSHMISHWEVLLSFTLKEEKSKKNQSYSVAEITPIRALTEEEKTSVAGYRKDFMDKLTAMRREEVEEPGESSPDADPISPEEEAAAEAALRKIEEEGFEIDEDEPEAPAPSQSPDGIPDNPKAQPGDDPFSGGHSNDYALARMSWEGVIPSAKDEAARNVFKNTYAARFYMRMAKKGFNHDDAKKWLFSVVQMHDAIGELSAKDILIEADFLQMVNLAFYTEMGELLFIHPDKI